MKMSGLLVLLLFFLFGCSDNAADHQKEIDDLAAVQQVADETGFSVEEVKTQNTYWKNMMDVHDEAMPIMGDLNRTARQLRELANSEAITEEVQREAEKAAQRLDAAQDDMMEWMGKGHNLHQLREDGDHEAILRYAQSEKEVIKLVGIEMHNALKDGRRFLQTHQQDSH